MAFESIADQIDLIEKGLAEKKSPRAIATEIGDPSIWQTIRRYKIAVFDLNKEANAAWRAERAKSHETRLEEGKSEIINTLEVINLAKLRARQLLRPNLGEEYTTADGELRSVSLGTAGQIWQTGQKMICDLAKSELEIAGDDPESRKATAIESLSEAELDARLTELLAVLDKAGSYPERRRPDQSQNES